MPRRGFVPKREVLPDPVYGNTIVTKLINQIMLDGKRGIAQSVCYDAFQMLADKTGKDAMEVFNAGLQNILPSLEVKARRVGGATYQVPIEIRPEPFRLIIIHLKFNAIMKTEEQKSAFILRVEAKSWSFWGISHFNLNSGFF